MTNAALERTAAKISDAFRPERKAFQHQINNCCRVKDLVQNHRFLFVDAVAKLETSADKMLDAFDDMESDNERMNAKYGPDEFAIWDHEVSAQLWLLRLMGEIQPC